MIAKHIVLSNIINVVSDSILSRYLYSGTSFDIKKVRYKVYSSHPRECLCTQAEGMVKPIKTLVLIQHHVERILLKNKLVIPNCQPLLLGENYIEIKA